MGQRKKKRNLTISAWGGFVGGKLYCPQSDDGRYRNNLQVFKTRAEVRRHFTDVRRVRIIVEAK